MYSADPQSGESERGPVSGVPLTVVGGPVAPTPHSIPRLESAALASVVDLVRTGQARTRPELMAFGGLGRKVITQRVDMAIDLGLLSEDGLAPSAGGRQARTLRFRAEAGHVYSALVGASEITVAIVDLAGNIVAHAHEDWDVDRGPEATMNFVTEQLSNLASKRNVGSPWAIGLGVPGPVDFATGRLVSPPIMPGWNGFSARSWFRDRFDAPVWVDNDSNVMALGEWTKSKYADGRDMLFVKVGTGVGSGLISRGRVLRGQRGAAGDIGHTHVTEDPTKICKCGRIGCLEAVAGGWSLLEEATGRVDESVMLSAELEHSGRLSLGGLGRALTRGDRLAEELVDRRAHVVAAVAANLVNFCNPGVLVVGGGVLRMGTRFIDIVADTVMQRCADLVTRDLVIRPASLDHLEGVVGAALLALENLMSPSSLSRWVDTGTPIGFGAVLQQHSAEMR